MIKKKSKTQQIVTKVIKNNEPLITVKDLVKTYKGVEVLKKVNLVINKGERVALIGANGAGKSTLSEIICKIRQPDSGELIYHHDNMKIGIQFQESNYPPGIGANDLIKYYINVFKINISKEEVDRLTKLFQVDKFLKKQVHSLSGGMKQRLNILLSIIHNPEFVLLDEISTGLDIEAKEVIREYVKKEIVDKNMTLLLVSHSMGEVEYLCERVVFLKAGEIIKDLDIKSVKKEYGSVDNLARELFGMDKKQREIID